MNPNTTPPLNQVRVHTEPRFSYRFVYTVHEIKTERRLRVHETRFGSVLSKKTQPVKKLYAVHRSRARRLRFGEPYRCWTGFFPCLAIFNFQIMIFGVWTPSPYHKYPLEWCKFLFLRSPMLNQCQFGSWAHAILCLYENLYGKSFISKHGAITGCHEVPSENFILTHVAHDLSFQSAEDYKHVKLTGKLLFSKALNCCMFLCVITHHKTAAILKFQSPYLSFRTSFLANRRSPVIKNIPICISTQMSSQSEKRISNKINNRLF